MLKRVSRRVDCDWALSLSRMNLNPNFEFDSSAGTDVTENLAPLPYMSKKIFARFSPAKKSVGRNCRARNVLTD